MTGALPCTRCSGEGREWRSRYGGNDPDVWDAGPCEQCNGSGDQQCEECFDPATVEYKGHSLCGLCHAEWVEDEVS